MGDEQQITLTAAVTILPRVRAFIRDACRALGIDNDTTYDIQLAVDEVISNVIEHGYAGLEPGLITVAWRKEGQRLILVISDFGHAFEPAQPEQTDVEARVRQGRPGGLGLYLVYNIMDLVSYEATTGGNTLTMVKELGYNKN